MINQEKINIEWIKKISKENRNADKILIEKVIRALLLLEGLVKQKANFVFKGGTALMLHFKSTKRLSIDIDIILPEESKNIDVILDEVVSQQGFTRKEFQTRTSSSKIKKAHFKFFYTPFYKTNKTEDYVLLDILFEKSNYQNIVQLPITSTFVPIINNPILVKVPSLEDILGDKLTAFAPNTTGIPYFKNKNSMSMEIIKQLYDIGNLFDRVENVDVIKNTFQKFAKTELRYRNIKDCTEQDVIEDIYQTALTIASRGIDGKGNFEQLQLGVQRIKTFIFSESYNIEKAIVHASKAAYLAMLIKTDSKIIERFSNPLEMKDWLIDKPMNNKLNKLKKSNPEAFFYWYKIYELKTEVE
ncbi:MAG: nucleotidyl transferase AbiEii/AbiGii toxin family protein [Melioribacteraceae bacterium]|nr:nucleotidyl transferase AbiEii/AbiGii toxin family protein [Melioribacteraceae bacterium]